jgi:seryl-tRNA synthetase
MMPEVAVGTQVLWYRYGRRRKQDAMVGYIIQAGARTATVFLANGRRMDAVRYIDDPKLDLSADQREQGAWDFTEDYRELQKFMKSIRRELDELTRLVTQSLGPLPNKKKKGNPRANDNLKEFRVLQAQCKEAGIGTKNMSKKDMENALAALPDVAQS